MDAPGQVDPRLVGYGPLAVLLFAVGEVAARLLRAVGGDLGDRLTRRRARMHQAGGALNGSSGASVRDRVAPRWTDRDDRDDRAAS